MISIVILGTFFSNMVYAQSWITSTPESMTDFAFNILWSFLNLLYLVTLPVLVIAGKAMDNSMIYWEFINLDKPLYMLRNLSRTFANFAIGWVILRKVVEYIFNFKDNKSPAFLKWLIMKSLGIILGINFSWFAIGALLDLSTLTTYWLWAMPLSILKETNNKDMPILSVGSYFDYQSKESKKEQGVETIIKPHTYYQRWNIYIPRCGEEWKIYKGVITWPEYFPTIPNKWDIKFNSFGDGRQYCALNTQTLADITDLEKWKNDNFKWTQWQATENSDKNKFMKEVINHINTTWNCESLSLSWSIQLPWQYQEARMTTTISSEEIQKLSNILYIWDSGISSKKICGGLTITGNAYTESNRQTTFMPTWWTPYSNENWLTMNTLINKSKGMVWPFITLYMSLLDFSNLSVQDTEDKTTATTLNGVTEFLLKWAISVALFIPLVALVLTLIIRVVILRWIIAFIPLGIVAYWLFDKKEHDFWWTWERSLWKINHGSIIWLIFAPVLPVFAISISIIILQTLQIAMKQSTTEDNKTRDFLWMEFFTDTSNNQNTSCMNFWGLQTTCLDKWSEISGWSGFANFLPWLFVNIFAIGLMWMMVKVALSGSTITSKIWTNVINLWSKALWAIPLVSIWWKWVWASSLLNTANIWIDTANSALSNAVMKQNKTITDSLWRTQPEKKDSSSSSSSWPSFTLTNKDKVFGTLKEKMADQTHIASFDNYKDIIKQWIEKHGWVKWKEESQKFDKASSASQAGIMADFITKLEEDKKKIDIKETANIDNISQQIDDLAQHTIAGWYSDYVDGTTIKEDKVNEFVQYLNNPYISKLLKDNGSAKNSYREKIEKNFTGQIEYKDGKFQATTTQ